MKVYPKREIKGNLIYLTLYDEKGNTVIVSEGCATEVVIRLIWEELEFVSIPEHEIFITFESIMKKFY
jgi:hypothetical protein